MQALLLGLLLGIVLGFLWGTGTNAHYRDELTGKAIASGYLLFDGKLYQIRPFKQAEGDREP